LESALWQFPAAAEGDAIFGSRGGGSRWPMNMAGVEHCRPMLVLWGLCWAALAPAGLREGGGCPGPGCRTATSHCHWGDTVERGVTAIPRQGKTVFEAQTQGKGARSETERIPTLFPEAISCIAVRCPTAPCQVPHRGKGEWRKELRGSRGGRGVCHGEGMQA